MFIESLEYISYVFLCLMFSSSNNAMIWVSIAIITATDEDEESETQIG